MLRLSIDVVGVDQDIRVDEVLPFMQLFSRDGMNPTHVESPLH